MTRAVRTIALIALAALPARAFAQQDSTVEWRLTLQDLERRLPTLTQADTEKIAAWRADEEALRAALAFYAAAHPGARLDVPPAGVKNVFDRNYAYTAGYPEAGRTGFLNLRRGGNSRADPAVRVQAID